MTVEIRAIEPKEAVRYLTGKGYRVSFAWQDMLHDEHAKAFTVAKMLDMDLLKEVRGQVEAALKNGTTFADFQKRLEPQLRQAGWWGRQRMVDPETGEEKIVQLGSPRRLRTIYDVNLRTAYAAGQWERIEAVAPARPWLRYVAVLDGRTRDEHRGWHGLVLRWDDDWWTTHYPPNGWNCRCRVEQLSDRDLERRGLEPSSPPESPTREWLNKRTGELVDVPDGIDPGWGYHPGKAARQAGVLDGPARQLAERLTEADDRAAAAIIDQVVQSDVFAGLLEGRHRQAQPVGRLPDSLATLLGTVPGTRTVMLSADTAAKQTAKHPEVTVPAYRLVHRMLQEGIAVQQGDTEMVFMRDQDGAWWHAAVKRTGTGRALFLTSLRRTSVLDVRRQIAQGRLVRGDPPSD